MRRTYELGRRDEQTKLVGQTRSASERNIRAGETRWGSEKNIRAGQTGWGEARENAFFRRSHVLVVYLQSAGGRRSQHGLHGRVRGVLHGRVRRRLAVSSHHRRIMSCPVARDAGRAPVGRHDGVGSRQPMRLTKRVPKSNGSSSAESRSIQPACGRWYACGWGLHVLFFWGRGRDIERTNDSSAAVGFARVVRRPSDAMTESDRGNRCG